MVKRSRTTEVARLPRAQLSPGGHLVGGGRFLVYVAGDGHVRATRNRCLHQGGRFERPQGCVTTCPRHGWRLNLQTMRYINPTDGQIQPELEVAVQGDDLVLSEEQGPAPWEPRRVPQALRVGELVVRFLAHACCEIQTPNFRLVTDPWLVGPAFTRGWWLSHTPPDEWEAIVSQADLLYISHAHSDHLNPHTLQRLARRNPDLRCVVADFGNPTCERLLQGLGFRDIAKPKFGEWIEATADLRLMILRDATSRDDSGILIDYRGHLVLNTVDSNNLHGGHLPSPVDLLLTSFAGGASGFPVCWERTLGEPEVMARVAGNRRQILAHVRQMAKQTQPRIYAPFAGYFTEAHPQDAAVRRVNIKNAPDEACAAVRQVVPDVQCWKPEPGDVLDLATGTVDSHPVPPRGHAFDEYVALIEQSMAFEPLQTLAGIEHYFAWAGFRGDLVLEVVETDDNFSSTVRSFIVDFHHGGLVPHRPKEPHRFLQMHVRATVFRHVLRNGLPWEELSIGFQARFHREPDVYNMDFWAHFQNSLPPHLPWPLAPAGSSMELRPMA